MTTSINQPVNLQQGDIFCTRNPMALGRAINAVQTFWSADNDSEYSHAGIITSAAGDTFESLWTIKESHVDKYIGKKVLIGRVACPRVYKVVAIKIVQDRYQGRLYPFWRLVFHLLPPLAKYISTGNNPVCSELMFAYILELGISRVGRWQGKNPDHAADFIKYADECEPVFEGIWQGV